MPFLVTILGFIWSTTAYVGPFLFVLAIIVFVHEFGHFLVGRLCGVAAEVFSLGIGPELVGVTDRAGTRWRLSLAPLGGYVRFAGERQLDQLAPSAARGTSLEAQSLPRRAAIVIAGPLANFLFAILVFASTAFFAGDTKIAPRIASVEAASAADRAGLKAGDLVRRIDGETIDSFIDIFNAVGTKSGQTIPVVVERDGVEITLMATPELTWADTPFGRQRRGVLGLHASGDPKDVTVTFPGPANALAIGVTRTWEVVEKTAQFVARLASGRAEADQLSGPIGIAQMSSALAPLGIVALINLAALLSVSLGLMNLVPIPVFDGGRLMLYLIEAISGRPLSRKVQELSLRTGLVVLLVLMVFVTVNDIRRIVAP